MNGSRLSEMERSEEMKHLPRRLVLALALAGWGTFTYARTTAYVQVAKTGAINTGYYATPQSQFRCDYAWTETNRKQWLFGINGGAMVNALYLNGNVKYAWAYRDGSGNWTSMNIAPDTKRRIGVLDAANKTCSVVAEDGAGTLFTTTLTTAYTKTATISTALAACPTKADYSAFDDGCWGTPKLYSFKISESGTLRHFFAPCLEDGVAGMKNIVTGAFCGNVGPGGGITYVDGIGRASDYKYENGTLSSKIHISRNEAAYGTISGLEDNAYCWATPAGVVVTAVPADGYMFLKWTGDVSLLTTPATEPVAVIKADCEAGQLTATFASAINVPVNARWTGAVDNDAAKPANWVCTDGEGTELVNALPNEYSTVTLTGAVDIRLPPLAQTHWFRLRLNNVSLAADQDWSDFPFESILEEATVLLNGHELRLAPTASPAARVTFSDATATPGTVRLSVASGTYTNTQLAFGDGVQLVKEGAGTYIANCPNQTYTGGTRVAAGLFGLGALGTTRILGAIGTAVTIDAGATFDLMGKCDIHQHPFVLNGGTIKSSIAIGNGFAQIGNLRLTADSTFNVAANCGIINTGYTPALVDLGGHKLTVEIASAQNFWLANTTVTNGTLSVNSGGWITCFNTPSVMKDVDFIHKLGAADFSAAITFDNFEDLYTGASDTGSAQATITGIYKPRSATDTRMHKCCLADGATLDLRHLTGTFSCKSYFSTSKVTAYTTFAAGTITVDLAGRTDLESLIASASPYVVKWETTAPGGDVNFVLDPTSKRQRYLVHVDGTGLRLARNTSTQIFFR